MIAWIDAQRIEPPSDQWLAVIYRNSVALARYKTPSLMHSAPVPVLDHLWVVTTSGGRIVAPYPAFFPRYYFVLPLIETVHESPPSALEVYQRASKFAVPKEVGGIKVKELEQARLEFIRQHARELHLKGCVAQEFAKDRDDDLPARGNLRGADAAWFLARQLWKARPEDC